METMTTKTKTPTMDAMRKRALAAVCQYLEAFHYDDFSVMDYNERMTYAKGVICRAAQVESGSFNRIGRERLRGLTAMFNKLKRDMDGVVDAALAIINPEK